MSLSTFLGNLLLAQSRQATPPTGAGWHRLPGGRIELRDTGFAIHLNTRANDAPYLLCDPEGRSLAYGYLQQLKELGEQMAHDRAEFGP